MSNLDHRRTRRAAASAAAVAFFFMAWPQAQGMADFTGRWVRVESGRDPKALEPHEPDVEEIQQTGLELQVTRRWVGRSRAERHIADGQERDDEAQPGRGARTRSAWRTDGSSPRGAKASRSRTA